MIAKALTEIRYVTKSRHVDWNLSGTQKLMITLSLATREDLFRRRARLPCQGPRCLQTVKVDLLTPRSHAGDANVSSPLHRHFFIPACQLRTTVNGAASCVSGIWNKKRLPSGEGAHAAKSPRGSA